jgi:hypothetical protein
MTVSLLVLAMLFAHLNRDGWDRRVAMIGLHALSSLLLSLVIMIRAVSAGLRRRALLAGLLVWIATIGSLLLPGLRMSEAGRPAKVTQVTVKLPDLPPALDGVRIILVSDLHFSPTISREELRKRLRPLTDLQGDLVVFAGDLATDGQPAGIMIAAGLLGELSPKLPRIAVLGNHDRWHNEQKAQDELARNGFRVLRDKQLTIKLNGTPLTLAGVDNSYVRHADIGDVLKDLPEQGFVLLLAHSPDVMLDPKSQRADLVLCGHTHGGQVNPPLVGPLACSSSMGPRYASGLHTIGRTKLFVTRGIGEVVTNFRLHCEPEIAVLELSRP